MTVQSSITLLNTRPVGQASRLSQLLTDAGFRVMACPAIEIVKLPFDDNKITTLSEVDAVFFISRNAVKCFNELIHNRPLRDILNQRIEIYSIGQATKNALMELGVQSSCPAKASDSATLLDSLTNFDQKNCLIVKGQGGLDILFKGLRAKGALVSEWSLYKRIPAPFCVKTWQDFRQEDRPCFLFSSLESWRFLITQISNEKPEDLDWVYQQSSIVFSDRIRQKMVELGWKGMISVVSSQSDQGILKSLTQIDQNYR